MTELLKCLQSGCPGNLGDDTVPMRTGCNSFSACRYCSVCGRIHSYDGYLMFGRAGHSPFFRNGAIELVLEPIELKPGATYKTTSWLWVGINDDEGEIDHEIEIIFDGMDDETFIFHDYEGVKYRLDRGDANHIMLVE